MNLDNEGAHRGSKMNEDLLSHEDIRDIFTVRNLVRARGAKWILNEIQLTLEADAKTLSELTPLIVAIQEARDT